MYRITAGRGLVPAAEVTTTDLLGLIGGKGAIHPQARSTTRNALNHIARKPDMRPSRRIPGG